MFEKLPLHLIPILMSFIGDVMQTKQEWGYAIQETVCI